MKRILVFLVLLSIIAVWFVPAVCHAGAVTGVTITQYSNLSNKRVLFGYCTLSTSYTSGGDTLSAAKLGLNTLENLVVLNNQASGYEIGFNGVVSNAAKIQVYGPNAAGVVSTITGAGQQDVFPYTLASITAADDIAGTTAFSTVAAVMGANYNWISTTAVPSNGVAETLAHLPDAPRNITFCVHGTTTATEANAATSWAIVGVYNGAAQTETVSMPAVSMIGTKMILKSGAKPFDSITSITPTITGGTETSGMETAIGIGSKIGLSRPLYTPAEADVALVTKTGVPVAISSITSTTNNTINFGTITANDYLVVKYKTLAYTATPTITGASAQASGNLATTPGRVYFIAIGY